MKSLFRIDSMCGLLSVFLGLAAWGVRAQGIMVPDVRSSDELGQLYQPEQPARTLTVVNSFGSGQPADGQHVYSNGVVVSASVASQVVDRTGWTRYLCMGAEVSGNAFEQPDATQVTMTITNDATLVWNWRTQYRTSITYEGNGQVSAVPQWAFKGDTVVVTATPAPGWWLRGWEGATNDCVREGLTLKIPMTRPRGIRAVFVQNTITSFDDFKTWPENQALRFQLLSGTWLHSTEVGGLYCLSPDVGGNAAFQIEVRGPGKVTFEWESQGDGTLAIGLDRNVRGTKRSSTPETASVAVPVGRHRVVWELRRPSGTPEASAYIRAIRWTPLQAACSPVPGNGQSVSQQSFTALTWTGTGDFYKIYAGSHLTRLSALSGNTYLNSEAPAHAVAGLIATEDNSTFFWRVDSFIRDSFGYEVAKSGVIWKGHVLAPGADEFGNDHYANADLTVGVPCEVGRFEILHDATDIKVNARIVSGSLPPGLRLTLHGGVARVTGVPTQEGRYVAAVQFSRRLNGELRTGSALFLTLQVKGIGSIAGSYDGWAVHPTEGPGSAAFTVTQRGRITGSLSLAGHSYTFSEDSFDAFENGVFILRTQAHCRTKADLMLNLMIRSSTTVYVELSFGGEGTNEMGLFRNDWSNPVHAAALPSLTGRYTFAMPTAEGEEFNNRMGWLTVLPKGRTRFTGILSDGSPVVSSGWLLRCQFEDNAQPYYLAVFYSYAGVRNSQRHGVLTVLRVFPNDSSSNDIRVIEPFLSLPEW